MDQSLDYSRSITIFSSREDARVLFTTIERAVLASNKRKTTINIVINGNCPLAREVKGEIEKYTSKIITIKLWSIPFGDKANAWNASIHHIYHGEDIAIFIDGYVKVEIDAIDNLSESLIRNQRALAASGIPPLGKKSAALRRQMLKEGGFHGNLCAIKGSTIRILQSKNAFLPVGIYRTDPTLGAFICFNLSPGENDWDQTRILISEHATWEGSELGILNLKQIISQFKRMIRQSKGVVENRAIQNFLAFKKLPIGALPDSAHRLCRKWCTEHKYQALIIILKNPLVLPYVISLFKKGQEILKSKEAKMIVSSRKI